MEWADQWAKQLGVPRDKAREYAPALLEAQVPPVIGMKSAAAGKDNKALAQKVQEAVSELKGRLLALEEKQGILKRVYQGHPKVTTRLTLPGFLAGEHTVTWYDDCTGAVTSRSKVSGNTLVVETPAFSKHLAFTIQA